VRSFSLTFAVVCALFASSAPLAQTPAQAEISVVVERANGERIDGLTASDFEVRVSGVLRPVSVDVPLGITLMTLVDVSASATRGYQNIGSAGASPRYGQDPERVLRGIRGALLDGLAPSDRFGIGTFAGGRIHWGGEFSGDPSARMAAVERAYESGPGWDRAAERDRPLRLQDDDRYGPCPIWDAVWAATDLLARGGSRRSVLLVTDGWSTGNTRGLDEVARGAATHGVAVDIVHVRREAQSDEQVDSDVLLRRLASETGGLYRVDDRDAGFSWNETPPPFAEIVRARQRAYVLRFEVEAPATELRSLDIRVARPDAIVHAPKWVGALEPR
jgi:hypothetical protein